MKHVKLFEQFVQDHDLMTEAWGDPKLARRNKKLFKDLVPNRGKADTVQGEMLRAINKMMYRWYNDGDVFFNGYGAETAGPPATYLMKHTPGDIATKISDLIKKTEDDLYMAYGPEGFSRRGTTVGRGSKRRKIANPEKEYEKFLDKLHKLVLDYIELVPKQPNNTDMYSVGSNWRDELEDEDFYDDDEWEGTY